MYKRILLKLSGEALKGQTEYGIDPKTVNKIATQIKEVHDLGVEIGIVCGGGNPRHLLRQFPWLLVGNKRHRQNHGQASQGG